MAKIAQYLAALVGLAMLAGPVKAQAQFPAKPVRIVVPYSAGGGLDAGVRVIAQKLGDDWKQPVIVDNRPGASGAIGAQAVAGSPADGYVLLAASPGETVLAPILNPRATFDPARELRPISLVATLPIALVAQASLPANTLDELKALANAKPGAFHYGTVGIGSSQHFAGELVKLQAGMSLGVVNYQGMAQAITELLGGHIQLVVTGFPPIIAHVKSGRLKVISVLASRRSPLAPDWPAMGEAGPPEHDIKAWIGFFGPAQLSPGIAAAISRDMARVVSLPEVAQRLAALGMEVRGGTPEEFSTFLKAEDTSYRTLLKKTGIKLE